MSQKRGCEQCRVLKEALRKAAIIKHTTRQDHAYPHWPYGDYYYCRLCKTRGDIGKGEQHALGCLAAPDREFANICDQPTSQRDGPSGPGPYTEDECDPDESF